MKRIVTHPGQAHLDDALSVGIALAMPGQGNVAVWRREPTAEDLEDPEVLVLDVGGRLQPELGNYDHHQLPREAKAACTFSLMLDSGNFPEWEGLRLLPWYEDAIILDAKGPVALMRSRGFERADVPLVHPIQSFVLSQMQATAQGEKASQLPLEVCAQLSAFASWCRQEAQVLVESLEVCRLSTVYSMGGIRFLCVDDTRTEAAGQYCRELNAGAKPGEPGFIAGMMAHSTRQPGWVFLRYADDPRLDFTRLEGDPSVSFAHKSGFLASVLPMETKQAVELFLRAVNPLQGR